MDTVSAAAGAATIIMESSAAVSFIRLVLPNLPRTNLKYLGVVSLLAFSYFIVHHGQDPLKYFRASLGDFPAIHAAAPQSVLLNGHVVWLFLVGHPPRQMPAEGTAREVAVPRAL